MPYQKAKVYSDGKHYIAIPHTERPYRRKRYKAKEEEIFVPTEKSETNIVEEVNGSETKREYTVTDNIIAVEKEDPPKVRKITKKQLFEETSAFSWNVLYSRRNVAGRNDDKEYV